MKAYENGKVSSWLKSRKDNEIVELKGVLGPGLLLDGSFNGNVVAFAAGTGLIPFLDLVYFIWRQEVTGNKTNNINLILHAKFSGKDFVFAADLLKECERMVGNSQILKIVLTEGDGSTRNDKRSVNLGDEFLLNDPTYIYICGPSGYNYYMKEKLLSRNVPRHKLVIL